MGGGRSEEAGGGGQIEVAGGGGGAEGGWILLHANQPSIIQPQIIYLIAFNVNTGWQAVGGGRGSRRGGRLLTRRGWWGIIERGREVGQLERKGFSTESFFVLAKSPIYSLN